MGSRHTRNSRRTDQNTQDQDGGEENPSQSNDTDSSDRDGDQMDLATVLAYLLRSGQVHILRGSGSEGIQLIHGNFDEDSDDEMGVADHYAFPQYCPEADPMPDTGKINDSQLKQQILAASGLGMTYSANVATMLRKREIGSCKYNNFGRGEKAHVMNAYLPNRMEEKARFRHKLFCGRYSTDGNVFLSACQDQYIRLFDTTKGEFKMFRSIVARDVGWSIVDTAYSPDQQYLIYSSWSDLIHLCNIHGDYEVHTPLDLSPEDGRFCAFSVTFSQDNKEVLAGANDCSIYVYDIESERRTLRIAGHDDDINTVAFADDSSCILFSGGDDGLCKVWDRRTLSESHPKPVGILAGHSDGITFIDSKGDGRHLLSNSKDQTIKLWDMRSFSSTEAINGTRRAVASQDWDYRWQTVPRRSTRFRKLAGDTSLMTYRGHGVLHTLIRAYFSPLHTTGQRYIYTGSSTGNVIIYDVLTGKIVSKLLGHRACVRDVAWHPYEPIITTSSWDGSIGCWTYKRSAEKEMKPPKQRKFTNIFL